MEQKIKTEQIIRSVLSPMRLGKLSGFASAYATHHTQVNSKEMISACTSFENYKGSNPHYEIFLGTQMSKSFIDNEEELTSLRFSNVSSYYMGLFYHEFFHVLYTNFVYVYNNLEKVNNTTVHNIIMNILNICEDHYIENIGQHYFPDSEKYIDYINKKEVTEGVKEKFVKEIENKEKIEEYKDCVAITWLLINDPSEFSKFKIYKDNKKFFNKSRQKILLTFDSAQRAKRQMLFATELLKMIEEDDYKPDENFDKKNLEQELKKADYNKNDKYDIDIDDETMRQMQRAFNEMARNKLREMMERNEEENKEKNPTGKSEGTDSEESKDIDKQDSEIKELMDKEPVDLKQIPLTSEPTTEDGFFLARMSNYKSENVTKKYMKESDSIEYLEYVEDNCNYINQIQNIINRIRLMSQGEVMHNQKYGKFDRKSACKQYPTITPFKRNIAPKILPDLVFHIIVDGSGSMSGRKEKEAINALLLFTTALERLGIPFAVEYFNDTYESIERVIVKEYNDKIQYKRRLSYIYNCDGWCDSGNIDEVNILHASQDLKARKEKDKFMIVISDGMTCGSEKDLHNLIVELDKQGLNPIGIGLGDRTVCGIYPTSIYLKNNDFEGLIEFLKGCLLKPFYTSLIKK